MWIIFKRFFPGSSISFVDEVKWNRYLWRFAQRTLMGHRVHQEGGFWSGISETQSYAHVNSFPNDLTMVTRALIPFQGQTPQCEEQHTHPRTCSGSGPSVTKEILKLVQISLPHKSYWLVSVAMHFLTKLTSFTTISPLKKRKTSLCELQLHYEMSAVALRPRGSIRNDGSERGHQRLPRAVGTLILPTTSVSQGPPTPTPRIRHRHCDGAVKRLCPGQHA